MKITNTQPRLLILPSVVGHKGAPVPPGTHNIDPGYWAKVSLHPTIRTWIDHGYLVPPKGTEAAPVEDPEGFEDLTGLNISEATGHIENEDDLEILQGWALADTRKGIQELIEDRLEELLGD